MKSEILRQIEKNKRAYYNNLTQVKNDPLPTSEIVNKKQTRNERTSFTKAIHNYLKKVPLKPANKFSFSIRINKSTNQMIIKSASHLNKLFKRFNDFTTTKSDRAIDRFYQFGASIFELNDSQNNEMQFQAIPKSEENIDAAMVLQLPTIPVFEPLQKLIRNILIFLESDSFSYSNIRVGNSGNGISKKLEYSPSLKKINHAAFGFISRLKEQTINTFPVSFQKTEITYNLTKFIKREDKPFSHTINRFTSHFTQ